VFETKRLRKAEKVTGKVTMSFIIFIEYCYNDPIKDDEMVGTRVTAVRREIHKAF
jgi:hypothetical protein